MLRAKLAMLCIGKENFCGDKDRERDIKTTIPCSDLVMSPVNQKEGFKQKIFFQLQKQLRASVEKIIGKNKMGGKNSKPSLNSPPKDHHHWPSKINKSRHQSSW